MHHLRSQPLNLFRLRFNDAALIRRRHSLRRKVRAVHLRDHVSPSAVTRVTCYRTYEVCISHSSTSADQNSRRQLEHSHHIVAQLFRAFLYDAEIEQGSTCNTPSYPMRASGYCSRNTLCRVLRGCSFDHCSTVAANLLQFSSETALSITHLLPSSGQPLQ